MHERRGADLVGKPGEAMFDINADFGIAKVGAAGDFFQAPGPHRRRQTGHSEGGTNHSLRLLSDQGVFQVAPFEA